VIAGGIFTSVKDLARKLRRYINAYSANAKPIHWRYSDPTRRIRSNVVSATCHWQSPNCHRHALREWLLALKQATLPGYPVGGTLA